MTARLVVLYGPPGVGKKTIGAALAERLGWPLHHQHLAFDAAAERFSFGTAEFEREHRALTLAALRTHVAAGEPGVVMTYCYTWPGSRFFVEGLRACASELSASLDFVRIRCGPDEHLRRVTDPARVGTNKISSPAELRASLERFDFDADPPDAACVDSTHRAPDAAAEAIATRLQLHTRANPARRSRVL